MLEKVARKVHLIHRRPSFRAHALTVAELEQSTVEIHTPYLRRSYHLKVLSCNV